MKNSKKNSKRKDPSESRVLFYAGYFITKFFDTFKHISFLLDRIETRTLMKKVNKLSIEKPIYIFGLARAGTTIVLEMLSKHPDLASHRYIHLFVPYLPHWISRILKKTKFFTEPVERFHKDGMMVTRDSPEAVEEIFWQNFFDNVHNENVSNIIDGNASNPKFEKFYRNNIRKLIISQKASRYLTKDNYNILRLEYLQKLFPDSKFLLIIRNPIEQIASLIKQTNHFIKLERERPLLEDWLKIIGHYEFGNHQVCVNIDNTKTIQEIRKLWKNEKTYVRGWAYYWAYIYDSIANHLEKNQKLKKATLIVRYDDLCEAPAKTIDNILNYTELSIEKFEKVKKYYIKHLHKPTYYSPNFSAQELAYISEITKATAARYELKKIM